MAEKSANSKHLSAVNTLHNFYANLGMEIVQFAVCPYILAYNAFLFTEEPEMEDRCLAAFACVIFSTWIPILPELTNVTMAIALFAAQIAFVSAFVAYPIALLIDAVDACEQDKYGFSESRCFA